MSEMHEVAAHAARETIRETFSLLGVDIDSQESINEFRSDLVYARRMRRMHDQLGRTMLRTIVGALVLGGLVWIGDSIISTINSWKAP